MSSSEKRKYPRYDARIKIKFKSEEEFAICYTKNISRGGIFVESLELPDPNATIELVLDLTEPMHSPTPLELKVTGKVVRLMTINSDSQSVHHVAIQFVDIPPNVQLQLDRYYDQLSD